MREDVYKRQLQSGKVRLPAYRAFYLDYLLKESTGVTYYRDQMLKAMVRSVKSVEDSDFTAPERLRGVLREYQRIGYVWLRTLDSYGFGGILADDMGLGKTIQIIALLESAYGSGEQSPSLIICPASLVYNWEHEIRRFAPDLKVLSVVGSGSEREDLLKEVGKNSQDYQVIITSYDLLRRDIGLYEGVHFRYQVIDEAQYIKNASTQSARAVKSLDVQTRFALTGTPVENRLGELWSIFDYLMPGFLFGSKFFKKEYEVPIIRDGDAAALERLKRMIGPFVLRRIKKDVLKELPDKMEEVVYSNFEPEQKKLYAANAAKFKEKLSTGCFGRAGEGKPVSYTHLDVYKRQVQIMEFQHVKPGKGAAFVRTKLKNVINGGVVERTFRPTEKFPQARIDRVDMQYLYADGELYNFMNQETYDQVALNQDIIGDALKFVKENEVCKVCSYNGSVFSVEPPLFVELEITETEPGFKGDTATGANKPATVETGATVYLSLIHIS